MIRRLVETPRSMPVKDRPAKRLPLHRVAIAAAGAVPTSQHKLELAGIRFAKQRHRRALESFVPGVVPHLAKHGFGVLLAVQFQENLLHQRLLIPVENLADAFFGDVPVVVDLFTQRVLERKRDDVFLPFAEAAV